MLKFTVIYIYSWIYKNMVENYSSFAKTGPNKGIFQPDEPENHRKERKEEKGVRASYTYIYIYIYKM